MAKPAKLRGQANEIVVFNEWRVPRQQRDACHVGFIPLMVCHVAGRAVYCLAAV